MESESYFKLMFFILVIIAVVLEVIADIMFKKWSIESKNILLYIWILIYSVGTVLWAISLKFEYLSKAISIFAILNLVIISLVGILYFKEDLSYLNKLGIVLGVFSLILIEI